MATIPIEARHLFENDDIAHLATINVDGSPQVSPVWVGLEDEMVIVNTNDGLVKTRNLRRDPHVAISISGSVNPYESLGLQGTVVAVTSDGADAGMDVLAKRYLGLDEFPFRDLGQRRVIVKIRPDKVTYRNVPDLSRPAESAALQLLQAQLGHLLDKDMGAWTDTFADHAVFELPFAPAGYPRRLDGKAAIHDYVKDYATHIDLQSFPDVQVHHTADPAVIVVEAQAEGQVTATGAPYRMRYVWVITAENGKVVRQRDYWSAEAAAEAFGGTNGFREAFNVARR